MASYPTAKVHRPSRRKLGKGQYPPIAGVSVVITDNGSTATFTFSQPVIVSGQIPLVVTGGPTFTSQAVVSPTVVTQLYSSALTGKPYTLPANAANVATYQGGGTAGQSGTFS